MVLGRSIRRRGDSTRVQLLAFGLPALAGYVGELGFALAPLSSHPSAPDDGPFILFPLFDLNGCRRRAP